MQPLYSWAQPADEEPERPRDHNKAEEAGHS